MIRIATYNVHRCRGMDRRVDVARVAEVVAGLDADVLAVQEILRAEGTRLGGDQVRALARALGCHFAFGETRKHRGAAFGNATFSRFPITLHENYDITWRHRERRGCLRTDIRTGVGSTLHVYNVHLGTSMFERPHQVGRLLSEEVLNQRMLRGPRLVMGDFNDWTRSVAASLMGSNFESVDMRLLGRRRTYPGFFPVLHLDHFYYDNALHLTAFTLHRSKLALLASDHLPLVAEFEWSGADAGKLRIKGEAGPGGGALRGAGHRG
jgi:endonuclease/exonuclease/phosphatase family metal-dependent hydrolase